MIYICVFYVILWFNVFKKLCGWLLGGIYFSSDGYSKIKKYVVCLCSYVLLVLCRIYNCF